LDAQNLFTGKNMPITITTHNNNPGLPAYVGQGVAALAAAGMKLGGFLALNGGGLNFNNHIEILSLTGAGTIST